MCELAVVGAKNSGKTTVIEGLVKYLVREGFRVATVKHTSHSHRFDIPGKDSYRHRQAGADLTIAAGVDEIAVFAHPDLLDIKQIQDITGESIDIWIIEGDRESHRQKILVTRYLDKLSDELPGNILVTIGPERLDEVPVYFELEDYVGLGAFVSDTILAEKMEKKR